MKNIMADKIIVRAYTDEDLSAMTKIWNEVVAEGIAFPQMQQMQSEEAERFFASQTFAAVAEDKETCEVLGLYILHPNNVGRCAHIANASYAVTSGARGKHIGEKLVRHSIASLLPNGFSILQFNAVVASNSCARHLYEKIGFRQLGTIPNGFRLKNGEYADICPYYIEAQKEVTADE